MKKHIEKHIFLTFFQTFNIPALLLKEQNNMLTSPNVSIEHFAIYNKVKQELYWNAQAFFKTPRRFDENASAF